MARVSFSVFRFLTEHFKGFRTSLVVTCSIYVLLILPKIAAPILSQIFLDNIISGVNPGWATPFFLACTVIVVYEIILRFMEAGNWKMQLRMTVTSTTGLLWHTLHLPLDWFHNKYAGEVAAKMAYPSDISQKMTDSMIPLISEIILTIVYVIFMFLYSVPLTFFALAYIVLSIVILRAVNKKRVFSNKLMQQGQDELIGFTSSSISNIEAIKGAGAEMGFFQRWASHFTAAQNATIKCFVKNIYLASVPELLEATANIFVIGFGVLFIIQGKMTIGMLIAFQAFMGQCMYVMGQVSNKLLEWANIKAKCEICDKIFQEPNETSEELEDPTPFTEGKLKGFVELRDVTFGYDKSAGPLISNFNLKLEPGKSVAFVGQSGCGKSTLAKLISGLYHPWSGEILFDGKTQDEINKKVFNNSVSVVDQNIVLFDGSVADNVKLWDRSIEDFAMIFACHDAQIHEEIASRSNAYDSVVENGGKNFSGGQRQRLEIASALAKEPVIMVMDEGTSALDAVTEEKVMRAIKDMGISLIMIAHRLSTIRDCDEIIVLEHGKVAERGTHNELMCNNGLYSRLVGSN